MREDSMDELKIKEVILDSIEASLEAQLRAVRRLKSGEEKPRAKTGPKGLSQVDMAFDILQRAGTELHVNEIIERIEKRHGQRVDRESLVSSLVKKVQRGDRFVRTDKNVFGLIETRR
jgi:predicted transcriptional regulator